MTDRLPQVLLPLPSLMTLMQRIQDAALHGFRLYVTGSMAAEKWPAFALKMAGRYEVDISRSTRCRRRSAGEAVVILYACASSAAQGGGQQMLWIMLASDGRGRVHGAEQLRHLEHDRISVGGFELVHDGKCWTWQMAADRIRWWRQRIVQIAQHPPTRRRLTSDDAGLYDQDIEALMDALYRQPGFRLVRRQVGHLVRFATTQWARYRPASGPSIRKRSFLPYVRRLPNRKAAPESASSLAQ